MDFPTAADLRNNITNRIWHCSGATRDQRSALATDNGGRRENSKRTGVMRVSDCYLAMVNIAIVLEGLC